MMTVVYTKLEQILCESLTDEMGRRADELALVRLPLHLYLNGQSRKVKMLRNRLRRMLMALDQATSDTKVDVDISPALGDMLGRFYKAHANGICADFVIRCRNGHVFKTNRMFACMLFDTIKAKVSQTAFSEEERKFFLMDTVHLWELKELIALMCGQRKRVNVSAMLRLLRIARRYLVPEYMLDALVASSSRLVEDQIVALEKEEVVLKDACDKARIEYLWTVEACEEEPTWFGYTGDDLSKADKDKVRIGYYYFYTEPASTFQSEVRVAALVVSEVADQHVIIRFYDDTIGMKFIKEVELASLHFLSNFSHVKPATIYPFSRQEDGKIVNLRDVAKERIPLRGDISVCASKIGYFCVRAERRHGESNTALILGVRDAHSIFILKDGRMDILWIDNPDEEWEVVGSISVKADQVERLMQYTELILHADPTPDRDYSADCPSQLEKGQYYGSTLDEFGLYSRYPLAVLLLDSDGVDSVEVCSFWTTPCIFNVPVSALREMDFINFTPVSTP
jgi:hypothetical protein